MTSDENIVLQSGNTAKDKIYLYVGPQLAKSFRIMCVRLDTTPSRLLVPMIEQLVRSHEDALRLAEEAAIAEAQNGR